MSDELNFNDVWEVVKSYYNDEAFSQNNIRSFDRFISNIPNIPISQISIVIENQNSIHRNTWHIIKFLKTKIGIPRINEGFYLF